MNGREGDRHEKGIEEQRTTDRQFSQCAHEIDWDTAGIATREDDGCTIGVECRRCHEDAFVLVTADRIIWNDED